MSNVGITFGMQGVEVPEQDSLLIKVTGRSPTMKEKRSKLLKYRSGVALCVMCATLIGFLFEHVHHGTTSTSQRSLVVTRSELETSTSAPSLPSVGSSTIVDQDPVSSSFLDRVHAMLPPTPPPTAAYRGSGMVDVLHMSQPSPTPAIAVGGSGMVDVFHVVMPYPPSAVAVTGSSGIVDVFHVMPPSTPPSVGSGMAHAAPAAAVHPYALFDTQTTSPSTTPSTMPSTSPSTTPSTSPTSSPSTPSNSPTPALRGAVDASLSKTHACPGYPDQPPFPGKKGACLPLSTEGKHDSGVENLPKLLILKPYWNYSWGAKRISAQPNDIEFVPMVWGGSKLRELNKMLQKDVLPLVQSGHVKRIFGFNEPDSKHQSNLSVERALQLWSGLESMNVSLTSTSCLQPAGAWMQSFMADSTKACRRVDWVGIHWYGNADFESFVNSMTAYHKLYGRPLVITEFAPADWSALTVEQNKISSADVLAFMKQALPWLEAQDWIAGYSWFSFDLTQPVGTSSALFDEQGNLTACGHFYASVRTDSPHGNQSIAITM